MTTATSKTIAVVTSSRADYGHLYWPLRELERVDGVTVRLLVTGAHLAPEFGRTVREIERDGFDIAERIECLLSSDTDTAMAKTIGLATIGFADAFDRMRPDVLLLIADRYEMMAPATAALAMRVPMAHIEGGEVSEGAIDHAVRNALTMMSHVHLTPTVLARQRVIDMGEEAWRVHHVGAPSLDHLRRSTLPTREAVEVELGIELTAPTIVVAYHPVTLKSDTTAEADAVFAGLAHLAQRDGFGGRIVFCFPNADAGSRRLIERAGAFCDGHEHAHLYVNLNHLTYWGLLQSANLLYGNSSSGIMETPSLGLPTVNIGFRQEGRERAVNIIDVPPRPDEIVAAVDRALDPVFGEGLTTMTNPYGDGHASERIAEVLGALVVDDRLLVKRARPALAEPRS